MRKSVELDHLLENAVAVALGLKKPHPHAPKKLRVSGGRPARRHHHAATAHRGDHPRAAA